MGLVPDLGGLTHRRFEHKVGVVDAADGTFLTLHLIGLFADALNPTTDSAPVAFFLVRCVLGGTWRLEEFAFLVWVLHTARNFRVSLAAHARVVVMRVHPQGTASIISVLRSDLIVAQKSVLPPCSRMLAIDRRLAEEMSLWRQIKGTSVVIKVQEITLLLSLLLHMVLRPT